MNENKETISEYCWAGRATGTIGYLLKKYAHIIDQSDVDSLCEQWVCEPFKLITQLALILRGQIPQQDSRIVDTLLEKSKSIIEKNPTRLKGKDQKEFEFGIKEVNYIIKKGENLEIILQDRVFRKLYKKLYCWPTFLQVLIWMVIIYGTVGGGVFMYIYCPYFVEQRLYDEIVNPQKSMLYNIEVARISTLIRNCESYIEQFPEGENIIKVKEIYNELRDIFENNAYKVILAGGDCGGYILRGESELGLNRRIEEYKSLYPNGKYLDKLYTYYDSLWTNEIIQYSRLNSSGIDLKVHNAILSMLKYMKDSHIDIIVGNTQYDLSEIKQFPDYCRDTIVKVDSITIYSEGEQTSLKDELLNFTKYVKTDNFELLDSLMCEKTNRFDCCNLYEIVPIEYMKKCTCYENIPLEKCPQFAINVKITNKEFKKNGTLYPQFFVIEGESPKIIYDINYDVTITLQMPNEEPCCIYKNKVSIADLEKPKEIKSTEDMLKRLEDLSVNGFLKEIGL